MSRTVSIVTLAPYSDSWPQHFEHIHSELLDVFEETSIDVQHIGSTAVPGLVAKPVIDVLLGADTLTSIEANINALKQLDYQYVPKYENELPMRRYFVRPERERPRTHLHAVVHGSSLWQEHIAFRNALRTDDALRTAYQTLKLELAAQYPEDKASYTAAKGPFIRSVLDTLMRGRSLA